MSRAKKCRDHLGNTYDSVSEMCSAYAVGTVDVLGKRLKRGWSLQKALETPVRLRHSEACRDHKGNIFESLDKMCDNYGISVKVFRQRYSKFRWSLKDVLETPVSSYRCEDHRGVFFNSKAKMCEHYGVSVDVFNYRISCGWSLKDALETPLHSNACSDHLGNTFSTIKDMCKYYSIPYTRFNCRINNGWTLKDALETPIGEKTYTDHEGNNFKSLEEMCSYWGIDVKTFRYRKYHYAWKLQKILETPLVDDENVCKDHMGNKYRSVTEMCRHYNINRTQYYGRLKLGWSIEEALTTPVGNRRK